jgi:hypothetical protein
MPQTPAGVAAVTPEQIRLAAKTALAQIDPALPGLKPGNPLIDIATSTPT